MTLGLNQNAQAQPPAKNWLVVRDSALSYGEQWRRCHALAQWCEQAGVSAGEVILVAVSNELEQASLLAGLICIGRVPIILDVSATSAEILPVLATTDFNGVIAEPELFEQWQLADRMHPWLRVCPRQTKGKLFDRLIRKKSNNEHEKSWPAIVDIPQFTAINDSKTSELAYIIFTSGTTSTPKGVEIGQRALQSQMAVLLSQFGLDHDCRLLNVLPLHHADGFVQGPLLAWVAGGTLYRPVTFSAGSIQSVMDSIYRERITHLVAVPTMLTLMLRLGKDLRENFDSPDFRFIISCAGHLEQALWEQVENVFGTRVVNLYGLTEIVTSALFSGPDKVTRRVGSLGMPINCEIQILNEHGTSVSEGEAGELVIFGEQLMKGYHNDTISTNAVLQNGWLRTGDLVRQLPSGHIEIVGRCKNLIISGGRNISPEEVAACLNLHPQVVESVVLGMPDVDWGERIAALVVVDGIFSETELITWCRTRLSEYKIPRTIFQVFNLDKGSSGKIRIKSAREQLMERLLVKTDGVNEDDMESVIWKIATRCFRLPRDRLTLESGPRNTPGWDSLAHMELVVALEKQFGFKLSPREIMQIDSLDDVIAISRRKRM